MPASAKIELVQRLQEAGLKEIEVTSFVSPKWVPQMADNRRSWPASSARAVSATRCSRPTYKASRPRCQNPPRRDGGVGAPASEAFSQKNINCSIAESIERFRPVVQAALEAALRAAP